jgi:geranylgeranyl reductase family protein
VREQFDVIIVGAGPGGSNAAAACLERGLAVAQIDRCRFPRIKPCAGGVTVKAAKALHPCFTPNVRATHSAVEVSAWGDRASRLAHRSELVMMVARSEFDNLLVRQNQTRSGFTFLDGESVTGIEFRDSTFCVTTSKRQLTSHQLIGADGVYSIVNRCFGISQPQAVATAIEVILPASTASPSAPVVPCFDVGVLPKGYGWIFPKDDHVSVGLYTFERGLKDLKRRLIDYANVRGFRARPDSLRFEAHQIRVGGYKLSVPVAPVYLVGDAGGFADALTGEGIYHALESGRLAGRTAADVAHGAAPHTRYYDELWRTVLSDTYISHHLARLLYRNPRRRICILDSPLVWRPCVLGYAEGATMREILAHSGRYLLRSFGPTVVERTAVPHSIRACDPGKDTTP